MARATHNDHPIHDLLRLRWSPRAFADRAIEPSKLQALFEAARWAPSSYNEQPWAFLVATKDKVEDYQRFLSCLIEFNQGWAKSAPVLVFTVAHTQLEKNGQPNRHAFYDLGAAVAHLTLQASAEGLFVHQMAGILIDKAQADLKIPQGWEVATALAIGYLGDPGQLPENLRAKEHSLSTRKALRDFVFAGSWGATSLL